MVQEAHAARYVDRTGPQTGIGLTHRGRPVMSHPGRQDLFRNRPYVTSARYVTSSAAIRASCACFQAILIAQFPLFSQGSTLRKQ
jgi:hypothetical protein